MWQKVRFEGSLVLLIFFWAFSLPFVPTGSVEELNMSTGIIRALPFMFLSASRAHFTAIATELLQGVFTDSVATENALWF